MCVCVRSLEWMPQMALFKNKAIYLFEGEHERAHAWWGGIEGEGEGESSADTPLSMEPEASLDLTILRL